MRKTLIILPIIAAVFILSGCGSSSVITTKKNAMLDATFIKSEDGAITWNPKMKIDDKKTIAGIDVLSIAIKPGDSSVIYIGTDANGIFMTKDAGETWTQVPFADKVYNIVFDQQNPDVMYGSGVFNKRAKIFKRLQENLEWKEIYTEPSDGTVISSLAIDRTNSQILYAGTSDGVIIKTIDGGETWKNLKKADGPVIGIGFDAANSSHTFFGIFQKGLLETKDGGKTIENITNKINSISGVSSIDAIKVDPNIANVAYIGTDKGIFRKNQDESWSELNIIESSKEFPIRLIAINPKNSKEIMYASAKAIYKSTDAGVTWSTFQLDATKEIDEICYDPINPANVYAGLRKF